MLRVRTVLSGWSGGPGLYTWYFDVSEDAPTALEVVERVHGAMTLAAVIWPSSITAQVQAQVDSLNPINGQLLDSFSVAEQDPIPGEQAGGDIAPPVCAILLKLQTSTFSDGSRIQGRSFFSPVAGLFAETDGTPHSTALDAVRDAGEALIDVGLDPRPMVVWRRPRLADAEHDPPITARAGSIALITSVSVADKFAVLRSRRD